MPRLLVGVLALLAAVAPLATDMYLPAFPTMAMEFRTSASSIQLTLTAFLVGLAVGQLVIGPISDRFGRRHLLIGGTIVCIAASVACALAPTIESLTAFRFAQGFTGAAGIVLSRAVISDRARGAAAVKALSLVMVISGVAPVVAPLLGGAVIDHVGWRGVFWVLTALAAAMLMGVLLHVRETHPPELRTRGGLRVFGGSLAGVLGNRRYLGYTLTFAFGFGVMFAYISASPFVFQNLFGLSTMEYSIVFACNGIGLICASLLNARLAERLGSATLLRAGILAVVALTALLTIDALVGPFKWLTLFLLWPTVASVGVIMVNATALAVEQSRRAAGTGSAVLGALQFGLAAVVSPLVGLGGAATATPMVLTMLTCAVLAYLASLLAGKRLHATSASPAP
ncbi:multidrug effflux MFS transporter [Nocardia sp. NBC_00881]|uniref:multidrug effflux MFS transporter n=1 Tax=Nocardia sp. NBC_00881 TaxID=2975995 RepID=UPI0038637E19|nr:multidrug effflux MFS transporter [Nocardia sp. NBC_00881]